MKSVICPVCRKDVKVEIKSAVGGSGGGGGSGEDVFVDAVLVNNSYLQNIKTGKWEGRNHHKIMYENKLKKLSRPPLETTNYQLPPMCTYCLSQPLLSSVDLLTESLEKENEEYLTTTKAFKRDSEWISSEIKSMQESDNDEEEWKLLAEIDNLMNERDSQEDKKKQLMKEEATLTKEYLKLVSEVTADLSKKLKQEEDIASEKIVLNLLEGKLRNLKKKPTIMDVYDIHTDGELGVINGMRLGRVDKNPLLWTEFNAACGHLCLLVYRVTHEIKSSLRQRDYSWAGPFLRQYSLRPLGSKSHIISRPSKTANSLFSTKEQQLPLYYMDSKAGWIQSLFGETDFDKGVITFLNCLNEVGNYTIKSSATQIRTIRVHGDLIESIDPPSGPYSIKFASPTEEWNNALKLMLTLAKQIVTWFDENYVKEK